MCKKSVGSESPSPFSEAPRHRPIVKVSVCEGEGKKMSSEKFDTRALGEICKKKACCFPKKDRPEED